jgi:predicted transcriptional regulator of viral defense system
LIHEGPSWDDLYDQAASQDGLFSTSQAAEAGYSPQLLQKHLHAGRIQRVRRGIYRLVHFPPGEHEDLAAVWLWSERAGVFSHETALSLHGLSDALPGRVHLMVPPGWKQRRLRVPVSVELEFGLLADDDRAWVGPVPVTTVKRTLADCVAAHVEPGLVEQALAQAAERGLVRKADVSALGRLQRAASRST